MTTADRHEMTPEFKAIIAAALEINIIDSLTLLELGSRFGSDYAAIARELLHYAFSNIHWKGSDHRVIAPLVDEFFLQSSN